MYVFADKGQPFIEMDKNRDLKGFRDDGGKNVQDIASFTMNQWEVNDREDNVMVQCQTCSPYLSNLSSPPVKVKLT